MFCKKYPINCNAQKYSKSDPIKVMKYLKLGSGGRLLRSSAFHRPNFDPLQHLAHQQRGAHAIKHYLAKDFSMVSLLPHKSTR